MKEKAPPLPMKSHRRTVYLTDDVWDRLGRVATREDRSVNNVVRRAIDAYLDAAEPKNLGL